MVVSWENSAPLTAARQAEYLQDAQHFMASGHTTSARIEDGKKFHRAQPHMRRPDPLNDHIEERVEIARIAQGMIRQHWAEILPAQKEKLGVDANGNFQLNLMQASMFLCMDIEILRDLVLTYHPVANSLASVESFLGICKRRMLCSWFILLKPAC